MKFLAFILFVVAGTAWAQANHGELRFNVTDPSGASLPSHVELDSQANAFRQALDTDDRGRLAIPMLPYGSYQVTVTHTGFAPWQGNLEVRSASPLQCSIRLTIAGGASEIHVTDRSSLVDLDSPFSAMQIGSSQIAERSSSLPGRSVQDLIVSQPGWLYEGNAVLHPRGAEYQTQFVIDGIPLTDNRSPGLGPEIDADNLQSLSIYTAGFPAEYGRKMGGVVELNTRRQTDPGLHGNLVLAGGSFDTQSGYGQLQQTRKHDAFTVSASGSSTARYLNPVVPENFTNTGTLADFAALYERDFNPNNRLDASVRHNLARYLIPNELIQQQAGQRQNAGTAETLGSLRFQHILSPDSLIVLSGMVRHNARELDSNTNPTPIAAFQHNHFDEVYFKATYARHTGRHEFKTGVESDSTFLHENFTYNITDPTQFDPGTAPTLAFTAGRPDLEQSAFAEDLVHFNDWTASLGLRWDHYQLLLNRHALSPRLAVARAFRSRDLLLHASYDRVFQTPAFENILLSSSSAVNSISGQFLRLPVQPSAGNDFELGLTKGFDKRLRLDLNSYFRSARNAADDDIFLNTQVSYPIAFDRSSTYGAEAKLQLLSAGPASGFLSYSYMVSREWFPVTGGLFLGQDAQNALSQLNGHFAATQDQRNTLATRWELAASKRLRFAAGATYGSGLPFDYGGTPQQALAQYGPAVVSRLNFQRGRVLPNLAVNASAIATLFHHDRYSTTLHIDADNLNNRLNVLDFGGLFSGNAIAPGRSVLLRLDTRF
jgi:hypothetical protein